MMICLAYEISMQYMQITFIRNNLTNRFLVLTAQFGFSVASLFQRRKS